MKGFLICFCILAAPLCRADTVSFRSGEHPGFSRLVLTIPAGTDWQLGREGQDYVLQLPPQHDYDIRAAFDRIPRDRLAALTPVPGTGRLVFALGCDCHATAFLFAPGQLVIDVADGAPQPDSPFEIALAGAAAPALPSAQMDMRDTLNLLPDPLAAAATDRPRIAAAQAAILDNLARAATQGLLDIDRSIPAVTSGIQAPLPVFPVLPSLLDPLAPVRAADPSSPGISVQTAIDRDRPAEAPPATTLSGGTCLDDSLFDFDSWGDDSGYAAQIGTRLSGLTTERDLVPEDAVEALAKTYLYFGFGAEAEQALGLDGQRSPERDVLRALARIIDDVPVDSSVFNDQTGCDRPVALWSALGQNTLAGTTETERIAIQAAHRVLPEPLRTSIGTRLAQLFLDAGEAETAEAIIAMSDSDRDQQHSGPNLTEAEVALAMDRPETALATLNELANDEHRITPEALVALIDLSLAENRAVNDDILELAATLRFENRGTAAETLLGLAEVRALTSADRYADALSLLADDLPNLPPAERNEQNTAVIAAAAVALPDATFVQFAFGPLPQPLSSAAENVLAQRLLDLGFPDSAATLVAGPADTDAMALRRQLRARASIALGRVAVGEAQLTGMTDPGTEAILGSGSAADEPLADAETLWRAGDWGDLEQAQDPLLKAASRAMQQGQTVPAPDSTLAERQALLDEASATRDLVAELLARFTIDPDDSEVPTN